MDIAIINKSSLRIKTKASILLVNATQYKEEADIALSLDSSFSPLSNVRLNISGAGEYEAAGVKVTSKRLGESVFYFVDADRIKLGIGKMSTVEKSSDKLDGFDVVIVEADTNINMAAINGLEPKIIILFGGVETAYNSLGNEVTSVSKFSTTADKLPAEVQTVILK